jgi:DNA-binding CsgD family transcriptional regulator
MNEFPYFTTKEVAAQLGVTQASIFNWIYKGLIKPSFQKNGRFFFIQSDIDNRVPPNPVGAGPGIHEKTLKRIQRDQELVAAYRSGKTMAEIGIDHGISYERVRQRLKANNISGVDGGQHARMLSNSVLRQMAKQEKREKQTQKMWGCSVIILREARASLGDPLAQKVGKIYHSLRDTAQRQKIPWSVSFPEFVPLIKDQAMEYGRGKIVIMRRDSNKGYEIGNLIVVTHSEASTLTRRREQIINLYNSGHGPTEIAKKLNIAVGTAAAHISYVKNIRKFHTESQ